MFPALLADAFKRDAIMLRMTALHTG